MPSVLTVRVPLEGEFSFFGFGDTLVEQLALSWGGVILLAFLSNWVAKGVILRGLRAVAKKTRSQWDDVMVERKVFERLSHLAPALVVYLSAPALFRAEVDATAVDYLRRVANVWMILAGARTLHALLDALVIIGLARESTRTKPVRSYAQVVQLIVWVSSGILSVAVLMEKSPAALLTGLGLSRGNI